MRRPVIRSRKFIIAAAFVGAALVGLRAPAQTAAPAPAQVPAAPAGGIDPSKLPDIQGIHVGMTAQDMLPKLKVVYPGKGGPSQYGVNPVNVQYLAAPNPPWIGDMYGSIDSSSDSSSTNSLDKFTATFTGPPNKQVAVYLMRALNFQTGKFPTSDTMIAALKQKYGPNPTTIRPTVLAWAFDEQGQPVTMPASKTTSCASSTLLAPVNSINRYAEIGGVLPLSQTDVNRWIASKCGLGVIVVADWNAVNGGKGGPLVVAGMTLTMIENGEDLRDALAGQQYLDSVVAAKQQQQLKNAQGQSVPKL